MARCFECDLPDLPDRHNGHGDGIGSCDCARCEWCGGPPGVCNCADDEGPDWPDDVYADCGPGCMCSDRPPVTADVDRGIL